MSKMGKDHGSEYHLRRYLTEPNTQLSEAVLRSIQQAGKVKWVIPPEGTKEWKGMNFLRDEPLAMQEWRRFWPQRGNPPNWDAIARLDLQAGSECLLFEAKANHPEFCSPPCGAVSPSREIIQKALGRTKTYLNVHPTSLGLVLIISTRTKGSRVDVQIG